MILERLLPALGGSFGSDAWTVSELTSDRVLSALLAPLNCRKTGKLLSRSIGKNINGYSLERMGDERGVALWRVVRVL